MLRTIRDGVFLLGLAVVMVAVTVGPAEAAFPGRAGPLAYPRVNLNESADTGGLVLHGPRQKQRLRPLTTSPGDDTPSFSAGGRLVTFSGNHEPGAAPAGRHIYLVNVDGSGLRKLTSGSFNDSELVYMPSGGRIVFVSDRDHDVKTDRSDIFAMAPNGANQRVLIDGPRDEDEPDPAPNGKSIAFVSNRAAGINIFVAGANGRHVRQLTHNKRDCFSGNCNLSSAWSPDGRRHIAFLAVGRFSSDLEVMRADRRGEKEFSNGDTEEEGFGNKVGPPSRGPAVRP